MLNASVGEFGWIRVTEVDCSLRGTIELRGPILAARHSLVL